MGIIFKSFVLLIRIIAGANLKHTIVINMVGLEHGRIEAGLPNLSRIADQGESTQIEPVFPAVTCTVQASLLSGRLPNEHGIIANGFYDRVNHNVCFWEQASGLVMTDRIWDIVSKQQRKKELVFKSALLFWQNTMYSSAEIVVTPRPLHMAESTIPWCYSKPVGFYDEKLAPELGEFNLANYWGPFASRKSSEWIANAAKYILEFARPNLMLLYLPHLDYSAQRFGKSSPQVQDDLKYADELIGEVVEKTMKLGIFDETQFIIISEYGFSDVSSSVSINLKLRDAGLLVTRTIKGKEYLDYEYSKSFAMVDHQIAHVYAKNDAIEATKKVLENVAGISDVLSSDQEKKKLKIDHERSGELIAISNKDSWFNYYWWYDDTAAPSFASTVDIHRKPGYDPVELFLDSTTKSVPLDTSLVKSSHGRPPNVSSYEGLAAYVSNRKGFVSQHIKSNFVPNSSDIGKYLISLVT
jgi:predicted AlkP superfamily pyrophosphatase or phosphodiesterase